MNPLFVGDDGRPQIVSQKLGQEAASALAGASRYSQGQQRPIYDGQTHGRTPIEEHQDGAKVNDPAKLKETVKKSLSWQRGIERQMGIPDPSQCPTPLTMGRYGGYMTEAAYNPEGALGAADASLRSLYPHLNTPGARKAPVPQDMGVPLSEAIRAPSVAGLKAAVAPKAPPLFYESGEQAKKGDVFRDHAGMLATISESAGAGRVSVSTATMGTIQVGPDYIQRCKLLRRART